MSFLADKKLCLHLLITIETTIVVTKEKNVVSNRATDTGFVSPCNHEEYDTCMFLYAKPATPIHSELGYRRWCYWCGCLLMS